MASTPKQGWPVPGGAQAPATAADFAALGAAAEAQSVMVFATPAAMDTAIPPAARKAGMVAWINSLGRHVRVAADAQAGTLPPMSLLGSVLPDAVTVGAFDASKPLKVWTIRRAVTTDAFGDAILLSAADIGSGCILGGVVTGGDIYNVTASLRAASGNLVVRLWSAGAIFASGSAAVQGFVVGQ